jgi:hypothetical protein
MKEAMTAKEYAKKYDMALNYKIVAERAFNAGLKVGREETKTDRIKKMEAELKELRRYKKDMEETLHDPERLADLICGL